jgi:hypothetical protein
VVGEHLRIAIAQLFDQLRRSFDVGEEKGDRARRKLRHARSVTHRLPQMRQEETYEDSANRRH